LRVPRRERDEITVAWARALLSVMDRVAMTTRSRTETSLFHWRA
jgi:hypothetical protein